MAKGNAEVAAYILKSKHHVDKFIQANKQPDLFELITLVAEDAWSVEGSAEASKEAIYRLLNHSKELFLESNNDIRLLDYILDLDLSTKNYPKESTKNPVDLNKIQDNENLRKLVAQLSRFFVPGRALASLTAASAFTNSLTPEDFFDLSMIDYGAAKHVYSTSPLRKKINSLPVMEEHGAALTRIEKYGHPGNLFFSHLVIASGDAPQEVNENYRHFTAALAILGLLRASDLSGKN